MAAGSTHQAVQESGSTSRHTYASIGLSAPGVSVKWMAKQLGHSQAMFEKVYARWIESDAEEEPMQRLDEAAERGCPEVVPAEERSRI